ncbi:MAG TPA: hypothetical protein VJO12_10020 [Stellaceae bacterium]|nr:hypothetical protein [Stellaceae bacterium]
MSIEQDISTSSLRRQDSGATVQLLRVARRSSPMLEAPDAIQIAHTLTEKYGAAAVAFARERAARAVEVGDDIAADAWQSVIEATRTLLR